MKWRMSGVAIYGYRLFRLPRDRSIGFIRLPGGVGAHAEEQEMACDERVLGQRRSARRIRHPPCGNCRQNEFAGPVRMRHGAQTNTNSCAC